MIKQAMKKIDNSQVRLDYLKVTFESMALKDKKILRTLKYIEDTIKSAKQDLELYNKEKAEWYTLFYICYSD